jgi:hypothetical protein
MASTRLPRMAADYRRAGVDVLGVGLDGVDAGGLGRADLVDQDHVGAGEVLSAREVVELVPGPVRVGHDDPQVGFEKRRVVVAAVPDDDVRLLLGRGEDRRVVGACVHDDAVVDVRLVFFTLLDRAVVQREVVVAREPLHGLLGQHAVGHRVAHRDRLQAELAQDARDAPCHRALAAARAHGGDRDDRFFRGQHRGVDVEGREPHPVCLDPAAARIDVIAAHVRVGEDHLVDAVVGQQRVELVLGHDRDAVRVVRAGQLGRTTRVPASSR